MQLLSSLPRTNFNPRPPCGGRRTRSQRASAVGFISIHAPRAEGDLFVSFPTPIAEISIHAPRAEGDRSPPDRPAGPGEFQSTPPVRRATNSAKAIRALLKFQSTPPVRRATCPVCRRHWLVKFQSTPPVRRATHYSFPVGPGIHISIHAPRAEGDPAIPGKSFPFTISIHAPRAEGDR